MRHFDTPLTTCILCNSANIYQFHTCDGNIKIYKCKDCNIQFMNPQYTDDDLAEYYSQYTKDEPEWEEPLLYCHDYYISIIEKYIKPGKMLDIGAGKGYLLQAAAMRGWNIEGYETDKILSSKLSAKLNANVISGEFTSLQWKTKFDVVIMHQVLEHLKNPLSYIKKINEILEKNGILFICLPNINSRSAVIKLFMEKNNIRKKNTGSYYDTSHHLTYFTPVTLKHFLEVNGFKVLYSKSGHAARANQSKLKRFYMRNFADRILWKSTFLFVSRKMNNTTKHEMYE